jgi:hypothetical protein
MQADSTSSQLRRRGFAAGLALVNLRSIDCRGCNSAISESSPPPPSPATCRDLAREKKIPFTILSIDEFHHVAPNDEASHHPGTGPRVVPLGPVDHGLLDAVGGEYVGAVV